MAKYRILYTEDDETIAFLTKDSLERQYEVVHFDNGSDALQAFNNEHFDICVFDIMMPQTDGFDLAAAIRKVNINIPIIFVSAKTLREDRIKGLKIGADDYLVKPYSIEELILKIEIFLRRSYNHLASEKSLYTIGNCQFDYNNLTLVCGQSSTTLTQREADLLMYFFQHKNNVLKREGILMAVWGVNDYFLGRSLDVFISRLRKIFAQDASVKIENLHGVGFRFKVD